MISAWVLFCALMGATCLGASEPKGAADALARCRETFTVPRVGKGEDATSGSAQVTLTKVDGIWRATEASLSVGPELSGSATGGNE